MKRIIYLMMALICAVSINAQVTIGADSDPHGGAVLELKSTNKGLLLPRVSLSNVATYGLSGTASSATGMVVYNTNANITNGNGVGVYVWDGSKWGQIGNSNGSGGDNGSGNPSECGAYLNIVTGSWLKFMCYNLGATENGAPFTPSAAIHGAKYQWGKKDPALTQAVDQSNPNEISGWNTTAAADNAWLDGSKTANDPCPDGWRVPTHAQWAAIASNNTTTKKGTDWTASAGNYNTGMQIGDALFLPAAGRRHATAGLLQDRGAGGYYWSSTGYTVPQGGGWMDFAESSTSLGASGYPSRNLGLSIRCVAQ